MLKKTSYKKQPTVYKKEIPKYSSFPVDSFTPYSPESEFRHYFPIILCFTLTHKAELQCLLL